ncbi:hypothetical protein OG874_17910 [Nocardia sp. NBC_00565]|uniref:hypothetical protein n=1 Tax=Nocardia sp. NBC_00565 TaxID=2975993 RepID=UPI002E81671B|nr:hypothetical protein [Nocardia sp. NBC_00565]WUC06863.1 hypothetical protein OG874_17910 [Nocardia sp. NBC_00565]
MAYEQIPLTAFGVLDSWQWDWSTTIVVIGLGFGYRRSNAAAGVSHVGSAAPRDRVPQQPQRARGIG